MKQIDRLESLGLFDALEAELAILCDLPPALIHRLAEAVQMVIPPIEGWELSVEIDLTMVDRAKIEALAARRDEGPCAEP